MYSGFWGLYYKTLRIQESTLHNPQVYNYPLHKGVKNTAEPNRLTLGRFVNILVTVSLLSSALLRTPLWSGELDLLSVIVQCGFLDSWSFVGKAPDHYNFNTV